MLTTALEVGAKAKIQADHQVFALDPTARFLIVFFLPVVALEWNNTLRI